MRKNETCAFDKPYLKFS